MTGSSMSGVVRLMVREVGAWIHGWDIARLAIRCGCVNTRHRLSGATWLFVFLIVMMRDVRSSKVADILAGWYRQADGLG